MAKNFTYVLEHNAQDAPVVKLALQSSDQVDGGVDLVTLEDDGDVELWVLTINPDGTFFRHEGGDFADNGDEENGYRLVLDKDGEEE